MKKLFKIKIAIFLLFVSIVTYAQKFEKGFRLGYGLNAGIPLNNQFDFSLGVDIRLQYDLTLKTSLSATTGYTELFNKYSGDRSFIPLKLGFKSFLGNQIYILGEVGQAIGLKQEFGSSFIWTPGVGIATKHFDISLRYENYNKYETGQLSCRLAYGYKL